MARAVGGQNRCFFFFKKEIEADHAEMKLQNIAEKRHVYLFGGHATPNMEWFTTTKTLTLCGLLGNCDPYLNWFGP